MSIGKVDSVDLAAVRQAPAPAPVTQGAPASQAAAGQAADRTAPPVTREALATAVETANAYVASLSTSLQFSVDHDTGHTVVKMIDTATNQVLRQYPSDEMLAISKSIDRMQGLLVNRKA